MHGYTPNLAQEHLWVTYSKAVTAWSSGGAASRNHDTHNANLPHHPLLHQRNWGDGAQPAAKTRQAETREVGRTDVWLKLRVGKGEEKAFT